MRTDEHPETVLISNYDSISDPLPCALIDVPERGKVGSLQHRWIRPTYVIVANLQDTLSMFSSIKKVVHTGSLTEFSPRSAIQAKSLSVIHVSQCFSSICLA